MHFFKHLDFADTCIRKLISNRPRIVSRNVEKTLIPNLHTLCDMGFAKDEVRVLIVFNPQFLVNALAISRFEFWQNFLGTNERKALFRVFRRNQNLINRDIVSGIAAKIALLTEHGLSQIGIINVLTLKRNFIGGSSKMIKALLKRGKEFGLHSQSSSMFVHGLSSLSSIGSYQFDAKMEFFKGFGWSEEEFLVALERLPSIINLSDDNITKKMEFLLGRVGCVPSYIAFRPLLLTLSLEKRLMP